MVLNGRRVIWNGMVMERQFHHLAGDVVWQYQFPLCDIAVG